MRQIVLILVCVCFSVGVLAQTEEQSQVMLAPKFKPHYAGSSIDAGFMFTPRYGSGFYVAPKLRFQATPRLFVNAGVGVMQYSFQPSQIQFEGSSYRQPATGAYIFTEGMYLLNERWSINGSVMKKITPEPLLKNTPYRTPNEAAHFGIDYKITPNITVGARVGYSN
jgi:hypothetical protein